MIHSIQNKVFFLILSNINWSLTLWFLDMIMYFIQFNTMLKLFIINIFFPMRISILNFFFFISLSNCDWEKKFDIFLVHTNGSSLIEMILIYWDKCRYCEKFQYVLVVIYNELNWKGQVTYILSHLHLQNTRDGIIFFFFFRGKKCVYCIYIRNVIAMCFTSW